MNPPDIIFASEPYSTLTYSEVHGNFFHNDFRIEIYPPAIAAGIAHVRHTLAHELTHAWRFRHLPNGAALAKLYFRSPTCCRIEEAICDLTALLLTSSADPDYFDARRHLRPRTPGGRHYVHHHAQLSAHNMRRLGWDRLIWERTT